MRSYNFRVESMKSKGSGHEFFLSRAVEEPLEATFELGENIRDISKKAKRPVALGILGLALFITFLSPGLYTGFQGLFEGFQSGVLFLDPLARVVIYVFVLAICATTLVYLYQVHRFNTYLLARYSAVSELAGAQPDKNGVGAKRRGGTPDVKKPLANPIFAMMDMMEESMHELPQVLK